MRTSSSAIGKGDTEAGATGGSIADGNLSAMIAHDLLHEVEPEPGAAIFRPQAVEGLENQLPFLFGNAIAFVSYLDHPVCRDPHRDRSAIAAMFDGILHDIHQGALQRGVVGKGEDRLFLRLKGERISL